MCIRFFFVKNEIVYILNELLEVITNCWLITLEGLEAVFENNRPQFSRNCNVYLETLKSTKGSEINSVH